MRMTRCVLLRVQGRKVQTWYAGFEGFPAPIEYGATRWRGFLPSMHSSNWLHACWHTDIDCCEVELGSSQDRQQFLCSGFIWLLVYDTSCIALLWYEYCLFNPRCCKLTCLHIFVHESLWSENSTYKQFLLGLHMTSVSSIVICSDQNLTIGFIESIQQSWFFVFFW